MKGAAGRRIGGYRVVRELARGGMGVVYEVEREETGGRFAMKTILPAPGAQDPELLARFVREAQLAARLDHPHVVRTHAADLEGATPWLVQDLLPGGSLADLLHRRGRLPIDEAVAIARKVALGLAHAHERGVLHRDVKPTNVLLDADGEPRLVDFGLARPVDGAARLSVTGQVLGSPLFMAPEQALGDPVDARTDVYGAGALLYTLLAGEPPFPDTGRLGVLEAVISRPPRPLSAVRPDVPAAVEAVVMRAMAKRPGDRFPTAAALAEALAHASGPPRRQRSTTTLALVAGALLATALAGAALVAARAKADGRTSPVGPSTSTPTTTSEPSTPAPAAPLPGWRETFAGPGAYRLTWEERIVESDGKPRDNFLELTLALAAPTIRGDRATIAATVSAVRFRFADELAAYDSTSSDEDLRGFERLDDGRALIRALLAAPLSIVVDLRTGRVDEVRGGVKVRPAQPSGIGFEDPTTGAITPISFFPVEVLFQHVDGAALERYLQNVLHVFPEPGDDEVRGQVWCGTGAWFDARRRPTWTPALGRLELALIGTPTLRAMNEPRERRAADVRIEGEVVVVDGRIVRSTHVVAYENPASADGGEREGFRERRGTFTLERLEPGEAGSPR